MNETLRTIHGLRTTHGNFKEDPLPREHLEQILQASVRAANASNAQNYAIIVVEDRALMKDVCGYVAPVMLVYCVDFQRNMDLAQHLGLSYRVDPAWVLMTGIPDAILAAQTAVIAARSLGIDSLISNGVQRGDVHRLWESLALPPKNVYPVLALYLGYADRQAGHRSRRLFEPGVIHRGQYEPRDATSLAAILDATDQTSVSPPALPNWRKQGYAHYLEMFFKGPGGRARTAYGGLAPALEQAGIRVQSSGTTDTLDEGE